MRIVDLSTDVAGRFAARLFALAGVAVGRPRGQGEPGTLDLYLDSGKQPVEPGDLAAALAGADLVFTTFDQGRFLGAGQNRSLIRAGAVEVTTSSFGTSGPYAAYRGGPAADWAAGGYLWITGEPEREPLMGPEHLCGYVAGYAAALGAEAALRARARDGQGRHVDIATMDVMLGLHQSTFARASAGFVRRRTGRYAEIYPLTVLPCRSGHISLGVVSDEEFDRLVIAFGLPHLVADERFATREARLANCDALDAALMPYLLAHDAEELVASIQAVGVAATVVADPRDVLGNPQLSFRGFWSGLPGRPDAVMPGNPIPKPVTYPAAPAGRRADRGVLANPARDTRGLPLDGVIVLDMTAFWAGPSATRILADLGANVIWIERPRSRIDFDDRLADAQFRGHHLYHAKMNRHKRSVVLDLLTQEGRAAARALAGMADVVVENFRPGVAAKLGLAPEEICATYPDLVYVSLSGFGSAGPWGDWRSFGPNIEAASSILARTGYPDGAPMRLGHALPDGVGGVAGALAVLRGLREREECGRGGWLDISQLEVYAAICGEDILDAGLTGRGFPRIGNRARGQAVQGVFACRGVDEWIAIRLDGPADIERFAAAAGWRSGRADLETAPAVLDAAIRDYTATQDKHVLAAYLQGRGIEAMPVFRPDELLANAQARSRGTFVDVDCGGHRGQVPASPLQSRPPLANANGIAPRFGEHTEEVLGALCRAGLLPA